MSPKAARDEADAMNALIARLLRDDPRLAMNNVERHGAWERIARFAWQCRIGSMLLDHLTRCGVMLPDSARRQLLAHAEHVAAVNRYNTARLLPVLRAMNDADIPFLLLKGVALNAVLYDDPALRAMNDVDLMIHPRDAERADIALRRAGCTRGPELVRDDFYPSYHYEREYVTSDRPPLRLDVHVRPFRPLRYARTVPDDALWTGARDVIIDGIPARVPDPTRMLLHLLVHAACHCLREVRWLYDIKCFLTRFNRRIDIAALAHACTRWRLNLPAHLALSRVIDTFALYDPRTLAMQQALRGPANLFDRLTLAQAPRDQDRPVLDVLVNAACTPGLAMRLGYLRRVCVPDRAHLAQIYPHRHVAWPLAAQASRLARRLTQRLTPGTEPAR